MPDHEHPATIRPRQIWTRAGRSAEILSVHAAGVRIRDGFGWQRSLAIPEFLADWKPATDPVGMEEPSPWTGRRHRRAPAAGRRSSDEVEHERDHDHEAADGRAGAQ